MKIRRCVALMAALIITASMLSISAFADGQASVNRVRVGYVPGYGVINDPAQEGMMGYGYDYLMEIAKYTGWEYEFVECSFDNAQKLLEQGGLDIIASVQKQENGADKFLFSQREMDYAFRQLVVPADSSIFYDDFVSFKNMKVGVLPNTPYKECLQEYCMRAGFAVQIIENPKSELVEDLRSGTVDAIVTASLHTIPNTKVVAKIDAAPYYFAARKDNSKLMNELNIAMGKIADQDPFFTSKLHEKYFKEVRVSPEAFTAGEKIRAQNSPVLRVVADPNWGPFEYYDSKEQCYTGINIDIMERISIISGLTVEFIYTESYAKSIEMIQRGEADLLLGNSEWSYGQDIKYTKPYLQVPILLAGVNNNINEDGITVAIPSLTNKSCLMVIQGNPQYRYKDYGSTSNVVRALMEGKEDLAFVASYTFDEMVRKESTRTYYTVPTGVYFDISIGFNADLDPQIVSILNKSIDRVYQDGVSDIIYANTSKKEYKVPFYTLVKENSFFVISTVILFFIVVIVILIQLSNTHRKRMENLAYVDQLTKLSSFTRFKLDVIEMMKTIKPGTYMLVSMDINNFKYINDALGYDAGNEMLRILGAQILHDKAENQYFCRMSSDLFFFFVPVIPLSELSKGYSKIEYLEESIREGVLSEYPIIFSVGAYVLEDMEEDFYRLIDKASIARKSIKGGHTHSVAIFTAKMDEELKNNKDVTLGMERALKNREFVLYLQPKYSLESKTIRGAEALVRWVHPERGIIMPGDFIPMFERNGFILKLDLYMFEEACALIQKWLRAGWDMDGRRISVNLSRYCLRYPEMADTLHHIAQSYHVDTKYLEIELTESIVEDNIGKIITLINKLKSAGFEVSIDDFGSGYSSLNLLTDLPVDTIKIDKVFLEKIYESDKGKEVISRIISMVRALRMATVAEGVETEEQMEYLRVLGCDLAQGFFFSRPVTVECFEQLCKDEQSIKI